MKPQILFITLWIVLCLTISTASAACNDSFCYGNHNSYHNWHPYNNCRTCTGNNCQACSGSSGTGYNCANCNNCCNCNDVNCCPGSNCNCTDCGSYCPGSNCNCTSCGSSCPKGNSENSGNSETTTTATTTTNQLPATTSSGVTSYNPHERNIYEVGGNGQRLVLIDYANARDPTYQQTLDFIKSDKTDELPYTNTFVCSDFAEVLHNNAEKAGIRVHGLDVNSHRAKDTPLTSSTRQIKEWYT